MQMALQGAMHLLHELLCFFALLPAQQSWALQQQLCQIPLKPASGVLCKATNQELSLAYLRSEATLVAQVEFFPAFHWNVAHWLPKPAT